MSADKECGVKPSALARPLRVEYLSGTQNGTSFDFGWALVDANNRVLAPYLLGSEAEEMLKLLSATLPELRTINAAGQADTAHANGDSGLTGSGPAPAAPACDNPACNWPDCGCSSPAAPYEGPTQPLSEETVRAIRQDSSLHTVGFVQAVCDMALRSIALSTRRTLSAPPEPDLQRVRTLLQLAMQWNGYNCFGQGEPIGLNAREAKSYIAEAIKALSARLPLKK